MSKTRRQLKQDKKKLKEYISKLQSDLVTLATKGEGHGDIELEWQFYESMQREVESLLWIGDPDWSRVDDSDPRFIAAPLIKEGGNKCGEPVVPYEGQKCLEVTNNYGLKIDKSFVSDSLDHDIEGYIGAPGNEGVSTVYYEFEIPLTNWTNTYDETYRIEEDKGVLVEVKLDRYSKLGELYTIAPITDISMLYIVDKCGSEIDDGSNYIYHCILKPLGHSIQPKLVDSYLKIGQPI